MQRLSALAGVLFLATLPASAAMGTDPIPLGPLGGAGSAIVVDSRDPNVLLTLKIPDGLFRSTDGGLRFEAFGAGLPSNALGLTQDPRDDRSLFAWRGKTMYRSTDFGETWFPLGPLPKDVFGVKDMAIPTSGTTLLALSSFALFRSIDDGETWMVADSLNAFGPERFDQVEFAPSDPSIAYYCGTEGVFRSNDGGLTFFDPGPYSAWTQTLTVSPTQSDLVLAGTPDTGLQRSTDGGVTFQTVGIELSPTDNGEFFAWEPDGSRLWYGLLDALVYSTDLGETWMEANAGLPKQGQSVLLSIAFGNDGTRYVGAGGALGDPAGGGLFCMAPESTTWEQFAFLEGSAHDVMFAKPGGERVVAMRSGVWSGQAGEFLAPTAGIAEVSTDIRTLALDPTNSNRWVSGGTARGSGPGAFTDTARVIVLTNNGQSAAQTYEKVGAGTVADIQFNPNAPNQVIGGITTAPGRNKAILRSTNWGNSWTEVPGTTGWETRAIAWDRFRNGRVLQLSENNQWAGSNNGGQTWSDLQAAWPGSGRGVLLTYDPFQFGVIYRGETGEGLWRSDDDGATWIPLGVSLHTESRIRLHPDVPGLLWIGDSTGQLLVSTDRGDSFRVAWTAPGGSNVGSIDVDTSDGTLLVGTLGATTWELPDGSPFVQLGEGTAGSGGAVPTHFPRGGLPQLGNSAFQLVGEQVRAHSVALLALGFVPTQVPLFGGTLFVQSPFALKSVATGVGTSGEGQITFQLPIPDTAALVGARVVSQYAVLDDGAADASGYALSPALITTLLP